MTLKTAALLALVGTTLLTILVIVQLVVALSGIVEGVVPPIRLGMSLIHAFASVSVAVFFYAFHRAQG